MDKANPNESAQPIYTSLFPRGIRLESIADDTGKLSPEKRMIGKADYSPQPNIHLFDILESLIHEAPRGS